MARAPQTRLDKPHDRWPERMAATARVGTRAPHLRARGPWRLRNVAAVAAEYSCTPESPDAIWFSIQPLTWSRWRAMRLNGQRSGRTGGQLFDGEQRRRL